MGVLMSGRFGQERHVQTLHLNLQKARDEFEGHKTVFAAQNLRESVFPDSELFGHYLAADGRWIAEIRYDHMIHEAEGPTLADAIANAVERIVDAIEDGLTG